MARLFWLSDRWLAEVLVRVARGCRDALPPEVAGRGSVTFESRMLWGVMPDLARRLGARTLLSGEGAWSGSTLPPGDELRDEVGLAGASLARCPAIAAPPLDWWVVARAPERGSLVGIALDRIAPPSPLSSDWYAGRMRAASSCAGTERLSWRPDVEPPARRREAFGGGMADRLAGGC